MGAIKAVASCLHAAHAGMTADLPFAADGHRVVLLPAVLHPDAASEGASDRLELIAAQWACGFALNEASGGHFLGVDHHLLIRAALGVLAHAFTLRPLRHVRHLEADSELLWAESIKKVRSVCAAARNSGAVSCRAPGSSRGELDLLHAAAV